MNRHFIAILGMTAGLLSLAAQAAPGEYWEITNTMEMPGMPFAMPATTTKVCIPKGSENNPEKTSGDKSCKMTDIKTVGNKTTWKARCDRDGEVMTGTGEQTTTANGYKGKMQFSGKSRGQDMNMTMAFSGKRLGGSCDTEEQINAMKSQACDSRQFKKPADWIASANLFLQPGAMCAGKRKEFCDTVRKGAPTDAQAYNMLTMHEQQQLGGVSIVSECKLDMTATTRSICKTLNGKNYAELSAHCPAEAKRYRETVRRKECEGRSYTAETRKEDFERCMNGGDDSPAGTSAPDNTPSGNSDSGNPANEALEAARKLRSKFGF